MRIMLVMWCALVSAMSLPVCSRPIGAGLFFLGSILYNVGIIVGIVWLYDWFGLAGLGYGVVLGAVLHLAVQAIAIVTHGFRYHWAWSAPGLKTILTLMSPERCTWDCSVEYRHYRRPGIAFTGRQFGYLDVGR